MSITLRTTTYPGAINKGSALTQAEFDGNFTTLMAELAGRTISVFEYMTTAQIADVQARTLTLDVSGPCRLAHQLAKYVKYPAGSYRWDSGVPVILDQTIEGEGEQNTIIVPTGANTHGFMEPTSGSYNRCKISDLSISGGATTGSGIYFPTLLAYTVVLRNLLVSTGGNAFHLPTEFFTTFDNCFASSATGHGFFTKGDNTTTFINCYASQISTSGKYGYRSYGGGTFISCNGVDAGTNWGMFGSTVANDGVDTIYNCVFSRCNIEAFTDIGVRFLYAGYAQFDGGTVTKPSGTYTTGISIETSTSTTRINGLQFSTSGATPSKLADVFTSGANYDILVNGSNLDGIDENGTLRTAPTLIGTYVVWTPVIQGHTVAGTNTYSVQSGQYRIDGQMVTAWFDVRLSGNSSPMTGNLEISGLPFTAFNSLTFPGSGYVSDWNNITLFSSSYTNIGLTVLGNTSVITLRQSGTNVAAGTIDQSAINASSGFIRGCVQYIKK